MKAGKNKTLSKTAKIIISILLVIALVLGISVAVVAIQSSKIKKDSLEPPAQLSSWMDLIDDDVKINKIAIPGSHDSGTYGMNHTAETQDCSFEEQLKRGVRYFDVRVNYVDDDYVIFHGPINGAKYEQVLDDIKNFLDENPSEFLILDYQKFKNNSQQNVFDMLENAVGIDRIVMKVSDCSDSEFVENLTLGEVRGKCLVVSGIDYDKPYILDRGDGEKSGMALYSYYNGMEHRGNRIKFIENTLPSYIERYENEGSGIFVLQGQLTDLILLRGPRFLEANHYEDMNDFVKELKMNGDYDKINVIMRDFVSSYTSSLTIALNRDKGIVKDECKGTFDKLILDSGYDTL